MSELMSPGRSRAADPVAALRARGAAVQAAIHRLRWPLGALGVIVVAAGLARAVGVRPGYDPYGWLVWGHLTLHGALNTDGAPSWKPLPFMFTLPFALVGHDAVYLWMTTSFAVSLGGFVFAWRVAFHLVGADPARRYAAYAAGLVAALAVLAIYEYPHSMLIAQSDTMIAALCLAAFDCILKRRYRWAFWLLWLAALGRPEAWSLLGLYALWAWFRVPKLRLELVTGVVLVPLLWYGVPALTSKTPFSAANLAENSINAVRGNKVTGTLSRFFGLCPTAVSAAAGIAVLMAVVRRDRPVLVLTGAIVVWMAVEVAFALHGFSAVQRYMYEAGAGTCVLAGVFVGRVIHDMPSWLQWTRLNVTPPLAAAATLVILIAFAASVAHVAHSRILVERRDLTGEHLRTRQINQLEQAVRRDGAARILACGQPAISIAWQSILAFDLGTNVGALFFNPHSETRHPHPIVRMQPKPYGWQLTPEFLSTAAQAARCDGLAYRT